MALKPILNFVKVTAPGAFIRHYFRTRHVVICISTESSGVPLPSGISGLNMVEAFAQSLMWPDAGGYYIKPENIGTRNLAEPGQRQFDHGNIMPGANYIIVYYEAE